ncbi:MAG: dephospho-CoA kinase [Thaumarchaeota archaeon]|nr:MAG: dephospho-CoA kinase [Nitrososphaerota archaeon]
MLIVAITGMPGAGKSTAARALENFGMKRVVMGDVIREETKRRGLAADEKNTGEVMKDLRKRYGEGAVAELCLKSIGKAKPDLLVVDGIRSLVEVETFGRAGRVLLVGIHASRERRFSLLKERGRSDDPITYATFLKRDERELDVGIGRAIALADEVISNEHISPDALSKMTVRTAKSWIETARR